MKKGMEKGSDEAKIQVAKNLKTLGVNIELIIKATSLTAEQINKLKKIKLLKPFTQKPKTNI